MPATEKAAISAYAREAVSRSHVGRWQVNQSRTIIRYTTVTLYQGKHAPEIVYSPHRLKNPLIRTGERGEGKFREASWNEALDFTVQKMQEIKEKYGPQAIVSHTGRGTFEQSVQEFYTDRNATPLLAPFGSPNTASVGSLCYVSYGIIAPVATFGFPAKNLLPDVENCDLLVVWGANPATDSPPLLLKRIKEIRKKKVKLIAVDQMRSDIAQRADQWVAVRAGTDGALIQGLLHVIINEKLYDQDFVRN